MVWNLFTSVLHSILQSWAFALSQHQRPPAAIDFEAIYIDDLYLEPFLSTDASEDEESDDILDEDVFEDVEREEQYLLQQPEADARFIRILWEEWRLQVQESDKEFHQTFARAA